MPGTHGVWDRQNRMEWTALIRDMPFAAGGREICGQMTGADPNPGSPDRWMVSCLWEITWNFFL